MTTMVEQMGLQIGLSQELFATNGAFIHTEIKAIPIIFLYFHFELFQSYLEGVGGDLTIGEMALPPLCAAGLVGVLTKD